MTESTTAKTPTPGAFAPLRQTVFAVLWTATVVGNIGSFMRDVASAWLVTDLSASPTAVALIQTAATLPVFLLAIPAGVLSDILDRRRFLIFVQLILAAVSATLLLLSQSGALTVPYLIALTFVGMPFVVRTVQPVLETLDPRLEEAAATLGATRRQTILRVVLPQLYPAILTGFALAFARGVGEYGSVVFMSGNVPLETEITPYVIMTKLDEYEYEQATALAGVMLILSFAILIAINSLTAYTQRLRGKVSARPAEPDAAAGFAAVREAARFEALDQRAATRRGERVVVHLDETGMRFSRPCRHVAPSILAERLPWPPAADPHAGGKLAKD